MYVFFVCLYFMHEINFLLNFLKIYFSLLFFFLDMLWMLYILIPVLVTIILLIIAILVIIKMYKRKREGYTLPQLQLSNLQEEDPEMQSTRF